MVMAKAYNPSLNNLFYDHIKTLIVNPEIQKWSMMVEHFDDDDSIDIENVFLHLKNDEEYTLKGRTELVPGFDPINDLDGDGYINDTEWDMRVNTLATARNRSQSRIPRYYFGQDYNLGNNVEGTNFLVNVGNMDYRDFLWNVYLPPLVEYRKKELPDWVLNFNNNDISEDDTLIFDVVDEQNTVYVRTDNVELETETTYTVIVKAKFETLNNGYFFAYPHGFEGSTTVTEIIKIYSTDNTWKDYYTVFSTGSDVVGDVTLKYEGNDAKIFIDEVFLIEGNIDENSFTRTEVNAVKNHNFKNWREGYYDGLFLDTMTISVNTDIQGSTIIIEYPNMNDYKPDCSDMLFDLKDTFPDKMIIGNSYYPLDMNNPAIDGLEVEGFSNLVRKIEKESLDSYIARDEKGFIQLIQYNPIFHPVYNPVYPYNPSTDGYSIEYDKIYGLASYYLVHGDHTYYGYGMDGAYHLVEEKVYDAFKFNIGQPKGKYYDFNTVPDSYFEETPNLLENGYFNEQGDHWTLSGEGVNIFFDDETKYEGSYSARMENCESTDLIIRHEYFTLKVNTVYTLSAYIKVDYVDEISVSCYLTSFDGNVKKEGFPNILITGGNHDWKLFQTVFQTDSDIEGTISFRFRESSGTAWIDKIHLAEGFHGKTPVWAREFDGGLVIINSRGYNPIPLTVDLDKSYKVLLHNGTFLDEEVSSVILDPPQAYILIDPDYDPDSNENDDDDDDDDDLVLYIILSFSGFAVLLAILIALSVFIFVIIRKRKDALDDIVTLKSEQEMCSSKIEIDEDVKSSTQS